MKKIVKDYSVNREADPSNEDYKQFFEMFLICFVSDKPKYVWLKEQYAQMLNGIRADDWDRLYRKMGMLVRELEVFNGIYAEYTKLQNFLKQRIHLKEECEHELNEVMKSDKDSYGFFTRVTKQQKIDELEKRKKGAEEDMASGDRLQELVTQVIYREEIEFIKKRKVLRFNEFVKEFHAQRIKRLQDEMDFWNRVGDAETKQA